MFRMITVLCLARLCSAATAIINGTEVDCSVDCACCIGGNTRCSTDALYGENYCMDGCVDTMTAYRCKQYCRGNCYACNHHNGNICKSCKDTFDDFKKNCNKKCSVGCVDGKCNDDGTCSTCTANFEGEKCDICLQGKYGTDCSLNCHYRNCHCTNLTGCDSCKTNFDGSFCMECKDGYYGADCKMTCPSGCSGRKCMGNGTCTQCEHGYYGEQCKNTCSTGCSVGECYRNGTCTCTNNFTGTHCDECVIGKYGENCQQACGVGCLTSYCGKEDGSCSCHENFDGRKCNLCKNGLYGLLCDLHCSDQCVGGICSRIDGACTNGCNFGYSGNNCTTKCDSDCKSCLQNDQSYCTSCSNGYSGSTCKCPPNCDCNGGDYCNDCLDQWMNPGYQCKCHKIYCTNNACTTCLSSTFFLTSSDNSCCECPQNCKGAFCTRGPQCTSGCADAFYGMDCSQKCTDINAECFICSQYDGMCLVCREGFYPNETGNCISCNDNCKNGQCDSDTGRCIKGCEGTFWGDKCDILCSSSCETCQQESGICFSCVEQTVHGLFCNESCISSCFEGKCEQITGLCSLGCERNFFGNMCQTNCPENCLQTETKTSCNTDGDCLYGCINDLEGRYCTGRRIYITSSTNIALAALVGVFATLFISTAAVCYLWNRRRSKPIEQSSEIQLDQIETEKAYEQLQRQAIEPTYRNVDDNYTVLSI